MAACANVHVKVFGSNRGCHFVHAPVTSLTSHALGDMNLVVKIYVIRQVIDPIPLDRRPVGITVTNWLKACCGFRDLAVAGHAGFAWRKISERGLVDAGVAVAAVHPDRGNVDDVRKWDGLWNCDADLRKCWRVEIPGQGSGDNYTQDK